jgi:uroporphyrinogen III methyltransferase/synthase
MGVGNIELISKRLIEYGKSPNTPIAFIENASLDNQRVIKSILAEANSCVASNSIKSPCVIVIGECANFNMHCRASSVAVTGTDMFCDKLGKGLWGYDVKRRCKMSTNAIYSDELKSCLENIIEYEWLVLTSSNGVEYFFSALEKYKVDIRKLCKLKFAVIGKGTYDTLAQRGIFADFIPEVYSTDCLGKELSQLVKGKVLMLRADNSRSMKSYFKESEDFAIYSLKADTITECNEDYIVFGSSSCARQYLADVKIDSKTTIIAIGEATATTIKNNGYSCIMADEYTVDGIINKIEAIENAKNA